METNITLSTSQDGTEEHIPLMLVPGDLVCRYLGVTDPDSRLLLRMFVNLTVYSKIGIILMLFWLGVL